MKRLLVFLDENIEVILASIALIIFSILTITQVIMRYVFNNPLSWTEELARYLFIWFVYISGSYAVKYQRHVKLSFIVDKFKEPIKSYIQLCSLLLWLSFLLFLNVYSIQVVEFIYHSNQSSPANNLPMYLVYLAITIGSLLMTLRVIQHIILKVKTMFNINPKQSVQ